ncbi:Folylpolyglutamate synthase [Bienertia sinuspersici]
MTALSSLITKRTRADKSNSRDHFDLLFDYIKIWELEEPISRLKVIRVAGTKVKGSTCAFMESVSRNCGFQSGLFTSPCLIGVRERFLINGWLGREVFVATGATQLLLSLWLPLAAGDGGWWWWRRLRWCVGSGGEGGIANATAS